VCVGDFNIVRHTREKLRASRQTQAMTNFADFISEQGLIDLPMVRGRITWSNRQAGSRLDRFLISTEWEEYFPDLIDFCGLLLYTSYVHRLHPLRF
jgi:hypothetical protein